MNMDLAGLIYKSCAVYLDEIIVASSTFKLHLADLEEVLARLKSAGISLKQKKCKFYLSELTFLGYLVTPSGIHPDRDKVKAVAEFKVPTTVKQDFDFSIVRKPDALSRNPLPTTDAPLDLLPAYAVIGSLDLRALPPISRAAQKLNLSSKRKKQSPAPCLACDLPPFATNFRRILQTSPPPAPPCLLRAVNKVKDTPGLGKVPFLPVYFP
ncbi:hypothetical protein GJAV_G00015130 [Gymnothorax javanicus]|nr:hypothetical protein GJAV_G00015130 [Gymnothorax javanicus]